MGQLILYAGSARVLHRGDHLGPGTRLTEDSAKALLDSWHAAEAASAEGIPHVYAVTPDRVVVTEVLVSQDVAWRALLTLSDPPAHRYPD